MRLSPASRRRWLSPRGEWWLVALATLAPPGCGDDAAQTADASTTETTGGPPGSTSETSTSASATATTGTTGTTANPTTTTGTATDSDSDGPQECVVDPGPDAIVRPGTQPDGARITVSARRTSQAGPTVLTNGFATDVEAHPIADVVYVVSQRKRDRRIQVIDRSTQTVVQELQRPGGAHYGMRLLPDGSRLYVSNGVPGGVSVFDVAIDGTLTESQPIAISGWTAGLAMDPDGSRLWVGVFDRSAIAEVDTATGTVTRTLSPGQDTYELLVLPGRNELWASDFGGDAIVVMDLATGDRVATIDVPKRPSWMQARADESQVYVSVTGSDEFAVIDSATRAVTARARVSEPDFVDGQGRPLPGSNVNALLLDEASNRLFAARGNDNAVGIYDATSLALLGSIPTGWYPSSVALGPDGDTLVVGQGRATGFRGPDRVPDNEYRSGVSFVDLATLDLADATTEAVENYTRPQALLDCSCGAGFPIPSTPGERGPIEHVVLIVKENQTVDGLFGNAGDRLDLTLDPAFARWDPSLVPNQIALAERYAVSDAFYMEPEESDSGHTYITSTYWTEWFERHWQENDEYGLFGAAGLFTNQALVPGQGNFFSWVLDQGRSLRIYGEGVGILANSSQGSVGNFLDRGYPGTIPGLGVANGQYDTEDQLRAEYVAEKIAAGELAEFTYILLPNDHLADLGPGRPTPESMMADNDYGVGIVIEALSNSPFWEKTVVFIMQDDAQGGEDHIDRDRSIFIAVGPYVRRNYVSRTHASIPSVHATIEALLGMEPLGRLDASATVLCDMFTNVPDTTPFAKLPRVPVTTNRAGVPGARATSCMDFTGPDRNPGFDFVVDNYLQWRRGELTAQEAETRIAEGLRAHPDLPEWREESEEESFAYDAALAGLLTLAEARGEPLPPLPTFTPPPHCR
jgi:DNA-binding beta-propeller fold protein YncE